MGNYHIAVSLNQTMLYKTLYNVQLMYQDNVYYFFSNGEIVYAVPAAVAVIERVSSSEIDNNFIDIADEASWSC